MNGNNDMWMRNIALPILIPAISDVVSGSVLPVLMQKSPQYCLIRA
jgi:hypothetical protein